MTSWKQRARLTIDGINRRATLDPIGFMQEESERYRQEVYEAAMGLADSMVDRRLVMLSGPSAAGKTTTAGFLQEFLTKKGIETHVVSLDDFYRGRNLAPLLENGEYDYEALEALDLPQLHTCMADILNKGETLLPRFDFHTGAPAPEKRMLTIGHQAVVIFEGIHALNPVFEDRLPSDAVSRIFIHTHSPIYSGDEKLLARRQLRLVRRSLRDFRFRNSPLDNTLDMWPQVVRGENLYMFPYVKPTDIRIDTTHAYEPCIFAREFLPILEETKLTEDDELVMQPIRDALGQFAPLDPANMPEKALLWEFIGRG